MKFSFVNKKGQFSIITALLISVIMVSAVIMTYANLRNLPFREPPKILNALEEMNLSLKSLLEYAVGYYGSILQVTGNVSYAKDMTSRYLQSGFDYIAQSNPTWGPSFYVTYSNLSTLWYEPVSYSVGNLSIRYSLSGLGISDVTYRTSAYLQVQILGNAGGQSNIRVTREGAIPDLTLLKANFVFYKYSGSAWTTVSPSVEPVVNPNGTYVVPIPSGVDPTSYLVKVTDLRGVSVTAFYSNSGKPQYSYSFTWNAGLYSSSLTRDTLTVEALQNGTLRWLGSSIQLSTQGKPLPPIPVRILRLNQTTGGVNREVPFQVEDWGSNYQVPLGLTSNASLFGDRQMIVFLVNHNVQQVTLWWSGRDTVKQTSYAFTNRYFTGDNPSIRQLTNGILTITISSDFSAITSRIAGGSINSTTRFMRINGDRPTYGSGPSYVIYRGIVRDIIQQEAEWSGGVAGSPNVYSQMYFTLPANATYYTYALRTIFVSSSQSRSLTDFSVVQLAVSGGSQLTEDGTSGGNPVSSGNGGLFYNSTSTGRWAHHWSEFISGSSGSGVMFTDAANRMLYRFDSIAGQKTGGLNVLSGSRTIEVSPVAQPAYPATFTSALEATWYGAVVTFKDNPIYPSLGNIGLWATVESPPTVAVG